MPVDRWLVHYTPFSLCLIAYLYALYFTYRKINLPSLLFQRKVLKLVLWLALLIFVTYLLSRFPLYEEHARMSHIAIKARAHLRAQTVWFLFLIVTGFSLSIELIFEIIKQQYLNREMEDEKNKAKLALYKAQINPHFLFNTLNTLYGLILINSDKAESAFIKFSNILKYMYLQTNADTIPLSTEIDYLKQFIDLQSLRLNKHTKVFFENNTEGCQMSIPPMLLITFVENAFKYGASSNTDCTISIRINAENGVLQFETENKIIKKSEKDSPSIGIDNCRKRLQLLYSGRFSLKTEQIDDTFKTFLTIKMNP